MPVREAVTQTDPWDDVLDFWFGETAPDGGFDQSKNALWWGHAAETDALIADRFGDRIAAASAGELDWASDPRGRLALVILLDQMRRNVHRGTAEMYRCDSMARALVLESLNTGEHERLHPIQRVFFYMPLEHSEMLEHQETCVVLNHALVEQVQAERDAYTNFADYAVQHRDIVARFGCFPHRNAILGRSSDAAQETFLKEPGSSF